MKYNYKATYGYIKYKPHRHFGIDNKRGRYLSIRVVR